MSGTDAAVIEAVALLNLHVPLAMADEGAAVAALGDGPRQALTYLAVRLFPIGAVAGGQSNEPHA